MHAILQSKLGESQTLTTQPPAFVLEVSPKKKRSSLENMPEESVGSKSPSIQNKQPIEQSPTRHIRLADTGSMPHYTPAKNQLSTNPYLNEIIQENKAPKSANNEHLRHWAHHLYQTTTSMSAETPPSHDPSLPKPATTMTNNSSPYSHLNPHQPPHPQPPQPPIIPTSALTSSKHPHHQLLNLNNPATETLTTSRTSRPSDATTSALSTKPSSHNLPGYKKPSEALSLLDGCPPTSLAMMPRRLWKTDSLTGLARAITGDFSTGSIVF